MKKNTQSYQNLAIGIFDSGIGGLTVLHSINNALPFESTVYLGDTARVPYGTKSVHAVTQYALEIGSFLMKSDIKALVVACNTASAVALTVLRERFSLPVIGMIEPAAKKAVAITKTGRIGVIGTEGTIRSGAYNRAIKVHESDCEVISKSCPLFVPLAEEGWVDNYIAFLTAKRYLATLKKSDIDTLILGCTHYPLFKSTLKKLLGESVTLVDSGEEAALELKEIFDNQEKAQKRDQPSRTYYVTDTPERFLKLGKRFLGEKIGKVLHVDIP